jgi:hypothetical protein
MLGLLSVLAYGYLKLFFYLGEYHFNFGEGADRENIHGDPHHDSAA